MMAGALRYVLLASVLSLTGCDTKVIELERSTSPDQRTTATLIAEATGGAVGDVYYYLHLREAQAADKKADTALTIGNCSGLSMRWRDASILEVSFDPGCSIQDFRSLWFNPTDIDKGTHPAQMVEIVLNRRAVKDPSTW